ncbi:mitochondrial carrier protein [Pseudoscourfieldia marina]
MAVVGGSSNSLSGNNNSSSSLVTSGTNVSVPRVALEWFSAGVGCALADTLFNPLEVLKVRRQVLLSGASPAAVPAAAAAAGTGGMGGGGAPSTYQLASSLIRSEGLVMGLWQPGLLATWMRGLSYTGFRIGLYPTVRDAVQLDSAPLLGRILAGGMTGSIGSVVFNPVDVVRIRMQTPNPPASTWQAFGIIAREGSGGKGSLSSLWRGWHASAARAATLSGSQLATYDSIKKPLRENFAFLTDAQGNETPLLHSFASLVSGFVAQTVTMPFDTMKTLIMADRTGSSSLEVMRRAMVAGGGVRVLFAGYVPALARQGPVMVVQMPIVEQLRKCVGLDYM